MNEYIKYAGKWLTINQKTFKIIISFINLIFLNFQLIKIIQTFIIKFNYLSFFIFWMLEYYYKNDYEIYFVILKYQIYYNQVNNLNLLNNNHLTSLLWLYQSHINLWITPILIAHLLFLLHYHHVFLFGLWLLILVFK